MALSSAATATAARAGARARLSSPPSLFVLSSPAAPPPPRATAAGRHRRHLTTRAAASATPPPNPGPVFDAAFLASIQQRIAGFGADPIPLIEGTPSTSRIKVPAADSGVRPPRTAAVLIPLCNAQGQASVLFQVRTSTVKTHKGQVSFPGGHIEQQETPLAAALRETREEVGEALGPVRILGRCQQLPAVTGTVVTPILGFVERDVGDLTHLSPSPDEVDRLFTLSLQQLLDPALAGHEDLGLRSSKAPFYLGGPAKVWGLTAFILQGVLSNVLRPSLATRHGE